MKLHKKYYEQALGVLQIEPIEARDSWHDVNETLPAIAWSGKHGESKTVLVWCLKRQKVFGGELLFEDGAVYWFTRSIEGDLTEIQHHISQVTHWRPIPPPPHQYQ